MTGLAFSCGACKFLRRKCSPQCVFAPHFSYDEATSHFAAVHKVFGASNVSKLLLHLPPQHQADAAISIAYEAIERMRDPIYGCVAHIFALQQEVASLQEEIEILGSQIANLAGGEGGGGSFPAAAMEFEAFHECVLMEADNYQNQMNAELPLPSLDGQMDGQMFPSLGLEDQSVAENFACFPW